MNTIFYISSGTHLLTPSIDMINTRIDQGLDRVPVPVIPIQGQTLHRCKKGGGGGASILKFEAPNL